MVDPRIYRALLALVGVAVIVFGFSLQNQPGGIGTSLAPGQFFTSAPTTLTSLTDRYREIQPGSPADDDLADHVGKELSQVRGFSVTTQRFNARTARGDQILTNVFASIPGTGTGEVVVVSHRDGGGSSSAAALSGTAVLLSLARALSGETLDRSVLLVSISGQVGAAGATQLASTLSGQPVDAVLMLGDLASAAHRNPEVVTWSASDKLAPPMLRNTVAAFVRQSAGIEVRGTGIAGQFVRLALPFSLTEQAPLIDAGLPTVLLSVSGDTIPAASEPIAGGDQLASLGTAVLQTVNALDQGPNVSAPSSYLTISGKVVPLWAVRLLVLALIAPVAVTAIDALARTRRRGHLITRWIAWVLCGAVPFVVTLIALLLARVAGLLSAAPPGAVGAAGVPITGGDVAVLLGLLAILVLAFGFLRPLCVRAVATALGSVQPADGRRYPETPAADAAAVALTLVVCALALIIWTFNPYAALLLVPALHLWIWLAQPGMRTHRWSVLLLTLAAALPAIPVLVYYANAYGLSPQGLVWSVALMIAGGAMSIVAALCWALALGCLASALVIATRSVRAAAQIIDDAVVTVRGPASYAGPGSLGGTESALRR